MKGLISSLPLAVKMIVRDPINLFLALVPTILALMIYISLVVVALNNSGYFLNSQYLQSSAAGGWVGKIVMALLILFIFLLMSWTFVIVVGLIASPFNSMLSSRIERQLVGEPVAATTSRTLTDMAATLGKTWVNEGKKIIAILLLGIVAFLFNLFPLLYPVGLFLVAILLAAQFVDYSWSRHEYNFSSCMKDMMGNILPYALSGGGFLILITVPLVNALVPALATSYYTVLWLQRNNRLPAEALLKQ